MALQVDEMGVISGLLGEVLGACQGGPCSEEDAVLEVRVLPKSRGLREARTGRLLQQLTEEQWVLCLAAAQPV